MAEADSFTAKIRYFRPERDAGLAVVDVPDEIMRRLGGLKQLKVQGTINGVPYSSSTMPAGGGHLALSVSKAMMSSAGVGIGDTTGFLIGREPLGVPSTGDGPGSGAG